MPKRRARKTEAGQTQRLFITVAVAVLVAVGLVFLLTQAPNPRIQEACELYKKDIFVRKLVGKPPYECVMSCEGVTTAGYCPEEMYMKVVLMDRAKELLEVNELNEDVMRDVELIHSSVDNLYILLLKGDERAESIRYGALNTKYFSLRYEPVYRVLKQFIETGNLGVLDDLYGGLVVRGGK